MPAIAMIIFLGVSPAQAESLQVSAQPTTARHDVVQVEQLQHERTSGHLDTRRNDVPTSMR